MINIKRNDNRKAPGAGGLNFFIGDEEQGDKREHFVQRFNIGNWQIGVLFVQKRSIRLSIDRISDSHSSTSRSSSGVRFARLPSVSS